MLPRIASCVLLVVLGCAEPATRAVNVAIALDKNSIELNETIVGAHVDGSLKVRNLSSIAVPLRLSGAEALEVAAPATLPPFAEQEIRIRWRPAQAGRLEASVVLSMDAQRETVEVTGLAHPRPDLKPAEAPTCPSASCRIFSFDRIALACVEREAPDGTACTSACIEGGRCLDGVCRGAPQGCDDHDACTADACSSDGGCVHVPLPRPEAGVCESARCDPVSGWQVEPVLDGTSCGEQSCSSDGVLQAQICLSGRCEARTGSCEGCAGVTQVLEVPLPSRREVYWHGAVSESGTVAVVECGGCPHKTDHRLCGSYYPDWSDGACECSWPERPDVRCSLFEYGADGGRVRGWALPPISRHNPECGPFEVDSVARVKGEWLVASSEAQVLRLLADGGMVELSAPDCAQRVDVFAEGPGGVVMVGQVNLSDEGYDSRNLLRASDMSLDVLLRYRAYALQGRNLLAGGDRFWWSETYDRFGTKPYPAPGKIFEVAADGGAAERLAVPPVSQLRALVDGQLLLAADRFSYASWSPAQTMGYPHLMAIDLAGDGGSRTATLTAPGLHVRADAEQVVVVTNAVGDAGHRIESFELSSLARRWSRPLGSPATVAEPVLTSTGDILVVSEAHDGAVMIDSVDFAGTDRRCPLGKLGTPLPSVALDRGMLWMVTAEVPPDPHPRPAGYTFWRMDLRTRYTLRAFRGPWSEPAAWSVTEGNPARTWRAR